jgi:hypothetical protein
MDPIVKSQRRRQEAHYLLCLTKHLIPHDIFLILIVPFKGLNKYGQRDTMAEVDRNRVRKDLMIEMVIVF